MAADFSPDVYSFQAMGSVCGLRFPGAAVGGEPVAAMVRELEAKWSRFLPGSEISVLNAHPGDFVPLSPETVQLLTAAQRWRRETGGLFDVAYAGADEGVATLLGGVTPGGGSAGRLIEPGVGDGFGGLEPGYVLYSGMARVTPGRRIDLGGVGKGVAADLALKFCGDRGVKRAMVNLGSSSLSVLTVEGEPWRIGIRSPWTGVPNPVGYLELGCGSVSISGTGVALQECEGWRTHMTNPLTGERVESEVALAVVVVPGMGGGSGVDVSVLPGLTAEVLSSALVLLGAEAGLDLCVASGVEAAVFTCDRRVWGTSGMTDLLFLYGVR